MVKLRLRFFKTLKRYFKKHGVRKGWKELKRRWIKVYSVKREDKKWSKGKKSKYISRILLNKAYYYVYNVYVCAEIEYDKRKGDSGLDILKDMAEYEIEEEDQIKFKFCDNYFIKHPKKLSESELISEIYKILNKSFKGAEDIYILGIRVKSVRAYFQKGESVSFSYHDWVKK